MKHLADPLRTSSHRFGQGNIAQTLRHSTEDQTHLVQSIPRAIALLDTRHYCTYLPSSFWGRPSTVLETGWTGFDVCTALSTTRYTCVRVLKDPAHLLRDTDSPHRAYFRSLPPPFLGFLPAPCDSPSEHHYEYLAFSTHSFYSSRRATTVLKSVTRGIFQFELLSTAPSPYDESLASSMPPALFPRKQPCCSEP